MCDFCIESAACGIGLVVIVVVRGGRGGRGSGLQVEGLRQSELKFINVCQCLWTWRALSTIFKDMMSQNWEVRQK